jgi:hypothetical protein
VQVYYRFGGIKKKKKKRKEKEQEETMDEFFFYKNLTHTPVSFPQLFNNTMTKHLLPNL